MIDIDLLVIESLKEKQIQREEDSRRLWIPIPEPELKPQPKEEQTEPKRVIEIQL
tara:strand:+ start:374 stop:538 length:165 start_codon:yes stop_codon:yes gene_type:complete